MDGNGIVARLMLLDVSNKCLVVLFSDFGINTNPKILCPEDSAPGRPRATTPAEDRFLALSTRRRRTTTVPQLVADHFQASGRRISATTVRNRLFTMQVCCVQKRKTSCVRSPQRTTAKEPLMLGKGMFLGHAATMGFCAVLRRAVQIYNGVIQGRLLIWEQRTRYHQSNTVERYTVTGWWNPGLGRYLCSVATLTCMFHGGTVTGLRYRDMRSLDPYVRPYAASIGNDFILMDDNGKPHRARIVKEYLEDHGLERMEWPARSPDLNPIEHLWDYLGRGVAAKSPSMLHELKQGLLCVWSSLLFGVRQLNKHGKSMPPMHSS
ncbi:transposable element Tcb2 transposase [Trichonephila clavipes]|nr:transposable element Tcb2 transposase [Trichonephila clavipes]